MALRILGPKISDGFCNPDHVAEQDRPDFAAALITNDNAMIEYPMALADGLGSDRSGRVRGALQRSGSVGQFDAIFVAAFCIIVEMEEEARHLAGRGRRTEPL